MTDTRWSRTSFRSSLVPMVIADDERRYIGANQAACLLLRVPEEEVLRLRIDDLTLPENRDAVESLWEQFIRDGVQQGTFELLMPDGVRLELDYSATANVEPGCHLSVLMFPSAGQAKAWVGAGDRPALLTTREREVLGMVAMGRGTAGVARALGVSPATVETHVRHCLEKLGARNRAHAIVLALRAGELALDLDSTYP